MKAFLVKLAIIIVCILAMFLQWNAQHPGRAASFFPVLFDFSEMNPENVDFSFAKPVKWTAKQVTRVYDFAEEAKEKLGAVDLQGMSYTYELLFQGDVFAPAFIFTLAVIILLSAIKLLERYIFQIDPGEALENGLWCAALYFLVNSVMTFVACVAAMRLITPLVQEGYVYMSIGIMRVQMAISLRSSILAALFYIVVSFTVFVILLLILYRERSVLYLSAMVWVKRAACAALPPFLNVLFLLIISGLSHAATAIDGGTLDGDETSLKMMLGVALVLCVITFLFSKLFSLFI